MARPTSERDLRRRLASNVRRQRELAGLTIEVAAERAEISARQWSRLEAGTLNTTLRTIAGVCRALRVDAAELLRG